jgi:hypothetical protein
LASGAGYCLQHGIAAESVEVGTGEREWKMAGDSRQ